MAAESPYGAPWCVGMAGLPPNGRPFLGSLLSRGYSLQPGPEVVAEGAVSPKWRHGRGCGWNPPGPAVAHHQLMILPPETQQNRQFPTASRNPGSQGESSRARNRAQGAAIGTVVIAGNCSENDGQRPPADAIESRRNQGQRLSKSPITAHSSNSCRGGRQPRSAAEPDLRLERHRKKY
jgi:hypothetical protein